MLLLKRHLVELVRRGKKRQTIRLWSKPLLRVGQISYTPGLGKMKITAIDQLPTLSALTEADARADGFDSLAALKTEIKKIYGPDVSRILKTAHAPRRIYRIKFDWPIDDAGRKLILAEPPPTKPAPRVSNSVIKPIARPLPATTSRAPASRPMTARRRSTGMTAKQRELLRAYVVAKHPHPKKPSPR